MGRIIREIVGALQATNVESRATEANDVENQQTGANNSSPPPPSTPIEDGAPAVAAPIVIQPATKTPLQMIRVSHLIQMATILQSLTPTCCSMLLVLLCQT
jgi:hypothetical protein